MGRQLLAAPGAARPAIARPARRSPLLALALVIFLLSIAVDLRVLPGDPALGQDYNDFYVAAIAQQHGLNPYNGAVLTGIEAQLFGKASFSNTVASPPAFFVAFRPLLQLSPRRGYLLWLGVSALAILLAARSLGRMVGVERSWLLWAIAFGPATTIAVFLGQISLLLVACYVWAIANLLRGRHAAAGVLLALTLVKPHLMIVPIALLCGLRWRDGGRRAALASALSIPALCALAIPFAEPDALRHWLRALLDYGSRFDRWQPDISSLAGLYLPYLPRPVGRALSTLCVLVGLGAAAWLLRRGERDRGAVYPAHWWRYLALGIALWLAVLPYVHPYDDTLALVPAAVLLACCDGRAPRGAALLALTGLIACPELDLMGFRPNLTFSYTVLPLLALIAALAALDKQAAWCGFSRGGVLCRTPATAGPATADPLRGCPDGTDGEWA